jgi:hypothetical protein
MTHKILSSQIVNPPLYDPARHMKLYIILLLMRISLHAFVNYFFIIHILLNLNNTHIELNKINVREPRRGNQDWRIKRHWQHWAHKRKTNNTENDNTDQHEHD